MTLHRWPILVFTMLATAIATWLALEVLEPPQCDHACELRALRSIGEPMP